MKKDFMPELPPDQRLQALRDNCDDHEETTYYRDLTGDELDIKREQLTKNLIDISKEDDILDVAKTHYKSITKPLKEENGFLLEQIKTRKAEVTGTLFHMADHDSGVMETFNELGEFISSRRLKPNERQRRMKVIPHAANDQ